MLHENPHECPLVKFQDDNSFCAIFPSITVFFSSSTLTKFIGGSSHFLLLPFPFLFSFVDPQRVLARTYRGKRRFSFIARSKYVYPLSNSKPYRTAVYKETFCINHVISQQSTRRESDTADFTVIPRVSDGEYRKSCIPENSRVY